MNLKVIKRYLSTKIGSKVVIVYYGSRNRKERYEGILCKLYHNIFTVRIVSGEIKSFSYIDILTKTIQIYV